MNNSNKSEDLTMLQDAQPSLLEYWLAVRRHRRMVVIVAVAVIAMLWLRPPQYKSVARLQLNTASLTTEGSASTNPATALLIHTELLTSQRTMLGVVDKLNLCSRWAQSGKDLEPAVAAARVKEKLLISRRPDQVFIDITAVDAEAATALSLANTVAEVFTAQLAEDQKRAAAVPVQALRKELDARELDLQSAREAYTKCRDEMSLAALEAGSTDDASPAQLRQQLAASRAEIAARNLRLLVLRQLAERRMYGVFNLMTGDEAAAGLIRQVTDADHELADASSVYGADHPELLRLTTRAHDLRGELDAHLADRIAVAETEQQFAEARTKELTTRIDRCMLAAWSVSRMQDQLTIADHNLDKATKAVDDLQAKAQSLAMQPERALPATIVDTAQIVKMPTGFGLLTTIVTGLGMGAVFAILFDSQKSTFKRLADFERHLGLPVVGVIGTLQPASRAAAVTAQREAYRILRNQLMFSSASRPLTSLCLLSAGAGEGKSFTVANLASVWAELGKRVLVVDTDLNHPTAHHLLGVSNDVGFADYLAGDRSFDQIVQTTATPGVSVIAAGQGRAGSFITPERIRQLVATAAGKFDLVLYDTPAILQMSDAGIVASEVGTCLMIVQHCGYPRHMARRARQIVQGLGVRVVGLVVNKVHPAERDAFFGYRDGYYYYNHNRDRHATASASDLSIRIAA